MMKFYKRYFSVFNTPSILIVSALIVFLSACGGSNKPSPQVQEDTNQAPVANAGPDQDVTAGIQVILDGSDSLDNEGTVLTYSWTQTSGEQVILDDPSAISPQFSAPNVSSASQLKFELLVNDGLNNSLADEVVITVNTIVADCNNSEWNPDDFTTVYRVGPGHPYITPSDVPWENIAPDTLVMIYGQDQPYRDKWVVNVEATAQEPVVILGVPVNGLLPVISGENAVTRTQ